MVKDAIFLIVNCACNTVFMIPMHDMHAWHDVRVVDEEKLQQTEKRFGSIKTRCVLYRGEETVLENEVEYRNVEKYLKGL